MPVAARVVRDLRMAARRVLAARDISAERRRATALDRIHHLQLVEAHMPAVGVTPSRTVIAENVRDLQSWSSHGRGATASAAPRCLASHACGAARLGHRAGSRSWRSARSQRGCSGPSSPASRVRAAPESRECPCRAQADGSRSCGEAYAERAFYAAPLLWLPAEQPSELACRQRPTVTATGKQPTLFRREAGVICGRPRL